MDYCGDSIGIRVSEDGKTCWVLVRDKNAGWRVYGEAALVSSLPEIEVYNGGSNFGLACAILDYQNSAARQKLLELRKKALSPDA